MHEGIDAWTDEQIAEQAKKRERKYGIKPLTRKERAAIQLHVDQHGCSHPIKNRPGQSEKVR